MHWVGFSLPLSEVLIAKNTMKINYILNIFAPKDTKFFALFYKTSDAMTRASSALSALFKSDSVDVEEVCKVIKHAELDGDKTTSAIHRALCETFITPFDREDVDALADAMDDCIDGINRVAQKVALYAPKQRLEFSANLCNVITLGVAEICESIKSLEVMKKSDSNVRKNYKEIKRLEEHADSVYEEAISSIFKNERDPIELIKQKEILFELEKTMNRINRVGKVLKTIFIKYA